MLRLVTFYSVILISLVPLLPKMIELFFILMLIEESGATDHVNLEIQDRSFLTIKANPDLHLKFQY